MTHNVEHGQISEAQGLHEPKGVAAATTGQVYVADGAASGAWSALEGTELASTGETGAAKFLREDGDNSSSWQLINAAAVDTSEGGNVTTRSYIIADGAGGAVWQAPCYQGVYDDNIGAHTTITGSGAGMTRISDVVVNAAATATGSEFTANADGSITYTGALDRHFHIACTIALDVASGTNITAQTQLQWYDSGITTWATVPGTNVQFNIQASGASASTAVHGDIMLSTNDKLVLAIENVDTATNLELVSYYLFALGMPGVTP